MKVIPLLLLGVLGYRQMQQADIQPFNFLSQVPSYQAAIPQRRKTQRVEVARPIPGKLNEIKELQQKEDVDAMDEDFQEFVDNEDDE
jgi:apolipoprotein N-acyltransferase